MEPEQQAWIFDHAQKRNYKNRPKALTWIFRHWIFRNQQPQLQKKAGDENVRKSTNVIVSVSITNTNSEGALGIQTNAKFKGY
jgi:hypothetical protein